MEGTATTTSSSTCLQHLITQALEFDSKGDIKKSLLTILSSLQESEPSVVVPREALLVQFSLAQNCFNRMQEIASQWTIKNLETDDENDYLKYASNPSSRRSSGEKTDNLQGGHTRTLSLPINPSNSLNEPFHIKPSPTTATATTTTTAKSLGTPKIFSSTTLSPDNKVDSSLSVLRKLHESELVAKQKEKTLRVLRAHAAGVLSQNEEYLSDLLKRRQQLYSTVNEKISELLSSISARATVIKGSIETERRRRSIKNAVSELNRQAQDFILIEPVLELFSSKIDPIAILLKDFINRCRQRLKLALLAPDPSIIVEEVLEEISIVEYYLVELLKESFEDLRDSTLDLSIKLSIQQFLFSTTLSPALLYQIRRCCADDDERILEKFIECSWEDLFSKLKVRGKLQLPRDRPLDAFPISEVGIYGKAIEELRSITSATTPFTKLLCMTRCCNIICQAVDEFRKELVPIADEQQQQRYTCATLEDSPVGSEDLLLLTAYVLVRAHIPDMASQLMFISKLVPEEVIRGEAGYVLATFQTSLEYALGQT